MIVAGIDEAGRGAIIGPLVIACVSIEKSKENELKEIGVKDSKQLTRERREEIYKEIEKIAKDIIVVRVQPCKIDNYRENGINLDRLEAMKITQILDVVDADEVYIDSLEQNSENFENLIKEFLINNNSKLIVKNYLDESVLVVGAASIVAKVERDKAVDEIKREINFDFGSGYPGDERTIAYIKSILEKKEKLPNFVRKSWLTIDMLKDKVFQKTLRDF